MAEFKKVKFVSDGMACVDGVEIPYRAVSENFPIVNEFGDVDATMFAFGYERTGLETSDGRPVLFAWNGGPGCGSLFVHMGLLSPMRISDTGPDMAQTAPFRLMNNDACLLDVCDVVALDAVGTGYARLLNREAKETYCSTQKDAEAFIQCIRAWLTEHKRWNSPIYIMGESFGTIRNAMIAEQIFYGSGIDCAGGALHLSGIIMLGSALDHGQDSFPVPKAVLNLPSMAAANWYWHRDGKGSLAEFVDECDRFCCDEYMRALLLGRRLPDSEREDIARKLSRYTGYPVNVILKNGLNVDVFKYPASALAAEGKSIGLYDARFSLAEYTRPEDYDFFSDDASNAICMPAFSVGFNGLWKDRLGIDLDEEYVEIWNAGERIWNYHTDVSPIRCLENAMHRNPRLRVMFGVGYYDMLTTLGWVRYFLSHYDIPPERASVRCYEAGHMPYLGDKTATELLNDIKAFILER